MTTSTPKWCEITDKPNMGGAEKHVQLDKESTEYWNSGQDCADEILRDVVECVKAAREGATCFVEICDAAGGVVWSGRAC